MVRSPHRDNFAVGYADGSVRLWSAETSTVIVAFNGHKKAVTAIAFDDTGSRLASGSQDTEIIIWDVLAETGLFRCGIVVFLGAAGIADGIPDCEAIAIK